jgi:YjbE family integral membrane protein
MPYTTELIALFQLIIIDIAMAGDNAIAVGTVASGLKGEERRKVVTIGIASATVLRILFAVFAVRLLHILGLLLAGGLLLLGVAYVMHRDIRKKRRQEKTSQPNPLLHQPLSENPKTWRMSLIQIIAADVSMSLDNTLAVAGVARDNFLILAIGLIVSVVLMGVAASWIAKYMERHRWMGYLGLFLVLFTSLKMIYDGAQQLNLF